ncbi:MAG: Crp/Fnr family transcriptional regulator [Flavobacteriaceae bacterium]
MLELLKDTYGYLFEEALIDEIIEVSVYKKIKQETIIIDVNTYIKSMPIVLNGAIKILREDGDGDELVLYYLEIGDTCAMTLSCCIGETKSKIRAVAETDVELLMIPKQKMSEWLTKYSSWQEFVLQSYHNRLNEFIEAIDTIAFLNMDKRLLKYLKDKALVNHNDTINVTHQEIANDLHTSRVVVSRLLKALEKKEKIKLNRNQIIVLEL